MWALAIAAPIAAYLLGSVPFGVVLARARGVDLRTVGSGNIGATNAARALGKKLGAVVLLLDALKGFAPVLVARLWLRDVPHPDLVVAATAMAAFLGHLFPVYQRFRGGKGVATALGVFLAVAPLAAVGAIMVYAVVYALWHLSSLGSLVASAAFVPLAWGATRGNRAFTLLAGVMFVTILITHRANIRRLIAGTEGKV
ncbi:MAG TPA: glycerol-3-phosphate 1-O-acyltransferase PlsY [Polyangia bacterium]|jgi:glycerol-3-phosphate acyltransferase PlsY